MIRLLVPSMEKTLAQPVIIDYRPGAGGLIGTEHVARSAPNGYTLLATVANSDSVGRTMAPPGAQIVADVVPGFEATPVWMAIGGPAGLPRPSGESGAISRWCARRSPPQGFRRRSSRAQSMILDACTSVFTRPNPLGFPRIVVRME